MRTVRILLSSVLCMTTAVLVGCGGDAAEEAAEGTRQAVEEADDTLAEAGVDTEAGGRAEVTFMGRTVRVPADESFGCFITPGGGSRGAIDFTGETDDGFRVEVEWAGDSPSSARLDVTTSDGTEYSLPFDGELEVSIDGGSAEASGTVVALMDPSDMAQVDVGMTCGG